MSDLIDRDALKKAIGKVYACDWDDIEKNFHFAEAVNSLPSAEPERKKGKWQRRKDEDCWECSECHAVLENSDIGNHNFYYCYHCGADMMDIFGYMDLEKANYE